MINKIRNDMNIIKKGLGFLLISFLLSFSLFAEDISIVAIRVSTEKGIDDADKNYITTSVKGKLSELLSDYTDFEIMDEENEETISRLWRKYDEDKEAYNEESSIEIGNKKMVDHILSVKIIQDSKGFYLYLKVINTETTGEISMTSVYVNNIDDLYANPGSPVHDIIIKLCRKFDIFLSEYDIKALEKGDNSLSEEDRRKRMLEEQKADKRKLDELLRKKEALSSSELDSDIERQKLDAELAILEAKQKRDEERQRKYEEDKERAKERERILSEKTSEQMAKSKERREELNRIEKEVLSLQMTNKSLIGQINVIENRKRALLEIRQNVENEKEILRDEAKEDCENKYKLIMEAPVRKAQQDSYGNMIPEVKAARQKEYDAYENIRMVSLNKAIDELSKSIKSKENEMLEKITDDYLVLRNKKANSLTKELFISYGSWDGIKKSWDLYIDFEIDGNLLFSECIPLSYTDVTGKDANINSQEYFDNVDIYDGLFLSNSPAFTYELSYDIFPASRDNPSAYIFVPKELKFYDTRTVELDNKGHVKHNKGKVLPFPKEEYTFYFFPKYSLENFPSYSFKYPKEGNERRTLVSLEIGSSVVGIANSFLVGCNLSYGINRYLFASASIGGFIPYGYEYVNPYISCQVPVQSKYSGFYTSLDIGGNYYIHIGPIVTNLYGTLGATLKNINVNIYDGKNINCLQIAPKLTLGVDIPINKMITVTTNASLEWAKETGVGIEAKLGIGYVIPKLHIFK